MRDPARIEGVLEVVRKAWHKHPNLRLGQLLLSITADAAPILFFAEDDQIARALAQRFGLDREEGSK